MKNTIVFCLKADNEESYSKIADFIYRRENQIIMTADEVQNVSYRYYLKNTIGDSREWARSIARDISMFSQIQEPHKIVNITNQYEIIYCICVDDKSDIINLGYLYLIKQHYTDLNIIVVFSECSESRYFTVSQFLYSVGIKNTKFYDDCYFMYRGNAQRAQINNISFSRTFTPLQIIDENSVKKLFRKCRGLVTVEYLQQVISKDLTDYEEYNDLLDGAFKILYDVKKHSSRLFHPQFVQVFQRLDVMAFVLLCYVICQEKEELSLSLLEKYAFQMQQYSNAMHQLAENIVFHSKEGCGIIAFRLHDKKSSYVNEKYKVDIAGNRLEVIISDFCRDNSSGNISDNFVAHLKDDNIKKKFKGMQPKNFFNHNDNELIKDAWEEFYQDPDNIGKHFGLRVFQSVVSSFGGIFSAESHCGYLRMPGDSFLSYEGSESKVCMPGTRYHIVFPIENVRNVMKKQDLSLDSGIDIGSRIKEYLKYTTGEIALSDTFEIFASQQHKNAQIKKTAQKIQRELEVLGKDIAYISLESIGDSEGEIVAKAMVMALFGLQKNQIVVIYQCTENLKRSIYDTMRIFFHSADMEGMFYDRIVQIVVYTQDYEEVVLDLSSMQNTDSINAYIAHIKCITLTEGYLNHDMGGIDINRGAAAYIPCDVLYEVEINGRRQTLFEHYTEKVLKNSIQKNEFGCQLEHTHMRLGSTIHIDKFYEAEILFGNKLFVSRFALLLVKEMRDDIEEISKLTLYGYGTYSETVLVQIIEMIGHLYLKKKDVDYIILEREEERRGFLHKDRIRYNRYFQTNGEKINYFKDRKIAIIVLINSTLKTHMRLINLFREETNIGGIDEGWLIKNYAVLLVGNAQNNKYWKLGQERTVNSNEKIFPLPKYFVQVDADYQEPAECIQCFPPNPVSEVPLIEVNAASTIPNQAFGVVEYKPIEKLQLTYELIKSEETKLEYVKNEFDYGHVHRNENHFLYYFKTENICIKQKDSIQSSLKAWKEEQREEGLQYNIIVSPMHYSNAGFVELVNNVVFSGNAILLRVDFDKEYRCNAYTKYSYLRSYVKQLKEMNSGGTVCVHYVDDAIISGRTFQRAKSLMNSILNISNDVSDSIEIKVFDKVFVLVDRNSTESRNQYVSNSKHDFYAFVTINISSLRNYGDSCVYCNLKKEADLLFDTSSTKWIADYWEHCAEKFQLYSLEEYNEINKQPDQEKHFRRLFCTHMAQYVLNEQYHGNNNVEAIYLILQLLNTDYESRELDKYEYFLSYLKCISRPFLVFKKAIKEAVFDVMLVLLDAIICNKKIRKVIREVEKDKPYLKEQKLIRQFNRLDKNILKNSSLSDIDRKDLVRLSMKQLTELKSNYIIRPEKMEAIFKFMQGEDKEKFEKDYLTLIDRLVGASSDTNKSIWLDDHIITNHFQYVPEDFRVWVILENTRAFRDGIEKFYKQFDEENGTEKKFRKVVDRRIQELEAQYDYRRAYNMCNAFEQKYKNELIKYRENPSSETEHNMEKKIERFLNSLPELEAFSITGIIGSLRQSTTNWAEIFDYVRKQIDEENSEIEKKLHVNETQKSLLEYVDGETDIYQFNNFRKLLHDEGYIQNGELSTDGADLIACCVKVLSLCRKEERPVLEKVQLLANLFKVILRAQKVQFIVENKEDNNLDEWKHNIERQYNEIVAQINEAGVGSGLETICIKGKKHYSVIVEKAGGEDYNTEVSDKTEKLMEDMECRMPESNNYIIDKTNGILIWKLGNAHRSIWINIENQDWCSNEPGFEFKIAKTFRIIMMFYQELENKIFNPENDDYINEISHARKELSIYSSNKVYTHTKDYSKEILFEQSQHYFRNEEDDAKYIKNYPSYILKLLADINISQYYRNGLKVNFYHDDRGMNNVARWKKFSILIRDQQEFTYCVDKTETLQIKLKVSNIDEELELLCRDTPSSVRELNMLIYALILNAAEQKRGKRQIEKDSIQQEQKSVIVSIYKSGDYLIIENESEYTVDLERIKRKLHQIPDSEDDGISLWSFNCYIRQCISSLILARLKEINCDISENKYYMDEVRAVGVWINRLTGQEYEIQPEQETKEDGKCYFRVKIPIFMEMYKPGRE